MKKLGLYILKGYLKIGMFFYFRRIEVHNLKNLPKNKPVLLLANHQNALLDPLLMATSSPKFLYYLTRAGVFKSNLVSKFLRGVQMLPVYRVRDGWNTITKNNAIFETCTKLLNKGNTVVIFPEGSHNLARRVRPLSKGFTRIVFETLERFPEIDLQLLPVGVNYTNAKYCPDNAAIYFGTAISAKAFVQENRNDAILNLKARIHKELTTLTTHIPEENYEKILQQLEAEKVNFLKPQEVNKCIADNLKNCKSTARSKVAWLRKILQGLLKIQLFLPYGIWKLLIQPKIKELEFTSTFRFAVALTLVPVYLLSLTFVIGSIVSVFYALMFLLISLVLALLAIKL